MYKYILCIFISLSVLGGMSIVYADEGLTPLEQVILKTRPKARLEIVKRIAYVIERESARSGLNRNLLAAVIWTESRFKYNATGGIGEVGLMQIRYELWIESSILRRHGVDSKRKLYWIGKNVRCGTDILRHFLKRTNGDIAMALYKYNSGRSKLPKGVSKYEIPYVNRVLTKMYDIIEQTKGECYGCRDR